MKRRFYATSKKALSVALAAVMAVSTVLVASPVEAATDIESDLIAHYSFEGNLSNEATGSSATMQKGTEVYVDNGISGKAFDFSANAGTATLDAAGTAIKLDKTPTTTAFTISMWVNSPLAADGKTIPGTYLFADGCCKYFQFRSNGDGAWPAARMCIDANYVWDAEADHWRTGQNTQAANKWEMVTITVSNTGKATVYTNGVEVASYWAEPNYTEDGWFAYEKGDGTYEHIFSDDNNGGTWVDSIILGSGDWWSENYQGLMDEVYIYERELTAAEVSALYAEDLGIDTVGAAIRGNVDGTTDLAFISTVDKDVFESATEIGVIITDEDGVSKTCATPYVTTSTEAGADEDSYAFRTIILGVDVDETYTAVPYMVLSNGTTVYGTECATSASVVGGN